MKDSTRHSDLPDSAGSIVDLNNRATINHEWWATLVPTTWDQRTLTFSGLRWYSTFFEDDNTDATGLWPVPTKELRKAAIIHAGSAPHLAGKRPQRRPGSVALFDGVVYTYCADGLLNGRLGDAAWAHPIEGIAPGELERHGVELVAGLI
ncbi:hypothetical protein V6S67_19325 [Arthrobacter sp. Soc17.1.1.1]|uniref:hypothetical protein n=1 Tax=Arthrobacter sp. Soc17.1.1.1 TaxID=3121277 RepID=UPI002FE47482